MGKTKEQFYEIIFEADTPAGKFFDVALFVVILISVALVMLESVPGINPLVQPPPYGYNDDPEING